MSGKCIWQKALPVVDQEECPYSEYLFNAEPQPLFREAFLERCKFCQEERKIFRLKRIELELTEMRNQKVVYK